MRGVLIVLMLASAGLAGCAGPFPYGTGMTMTAMDGLDDAREEATKWGDDPVLVGIEGYEWPKHIVEDDEEFVLYFEETIGDGRASGWSYAFSVPGRSIFVTSYAGIGPMASGYETEDEASPAVSLNTDSDEVADALADHPDWPDMTDATSVDWELGTKPNGEAVWIVFADTGDTSSYALVDAVSGDILEVTTEPLALEQCRLHDDEAEGTITSMAPLVATVALPSPGNLHWLAFGNGINIDVTFTVTGPNGTIDSHQKGALDGLPLATPFWTSPDDGIEVAAGTYQLTAETTTLATNIRLDIYGIVCS